MLFILILNKVAAVTYNSRVHCIDETTTVNEDYAPGNKLTYKRNNKYDEEGIEKPGNTSLHEGV